MKKKKKQKKQRKMLIDFKAFLFDFVKFTGGIIALIDLRPKIRYITGKKPAKLYRGKFLVTSNHVSFRDAVIMLTVFWRRRLRLICTDELVQVKFWGPFFRGVGCIPVNKDNVSMKTFKEVKETYRRGHNIGVFPEGSISVNGEIGEYKDGVIMMSILNDCPVIPMYIRKKEKWRERQLVIVGEKINFHDYISSSIPSLDEINYFTNIVRNKELELAEYAKKFK